MLDDFCRRRMRERKIYGLTEREKDVRKLLVLDNGEGGEESKRG